MWIIRRGAVELADRGQVLDLLGEGELLGHATMLSGLPTGLEARATEDTLVYRVEAQAVRPLLSRPEALPFVARSLLARPSPRHHATIDPADPSGMSVAQLARETAVICRPDIPIRDAARRMVDRGVSSLLVRDEAGRLGIVTDRDLRERVVAGGSPVDAPIGSIASSPAITMPGERTGADALLLMLAHGIRHVPVTTSRGEVAGIVRDIDLLAAQTSTPFILRRSIAAAPDLEALSAAAAPLRPTIVALYDATVPHSRVSAVISIVADAVTQRLIELDLETREQAPGPSPGWRWAAMDAMKRQLPPISIPPWRGRPSEAARSFALWSATCSTGWPRADSRATGTGSAPIAPSSPVPSAPGRRRSPKCSQIRVETER